MNFFTVTAWAEETSEIAQALENVTAEEALAGGTVLGMALGTLITFRLILFLLQVIADWRIFKKAGVPGWKSIIPFLNTYEEYKLSWKGKGMLGLCFVFLQVVSSSFDYYTADPQPAWVMAVLVVLGLATLVISIMQSLRMAKAFGKGTGFAVGLIILQPLFRLILGLGSAEYKGAQD